MTPRSPQPQRVDSDGSRIRLRPKQGAVHHQEVIEPQCVLMRAEAHNIMGVWYRTKGSESLKLSTLLDCLFLLQPLASRVAENYHSPDVL